LTNQNYSTTSEDIKRDFPLLDGVKNYDKLNSELSLLQPMFESICPKIKSVTLTGTVSELKRVNINATFSFGKFQVRETCSIVFDCARVQCLHRKRSFNSKGSENLFKKSRGS
jgi:hypothetical protein